MGDPNDSESGDHIKNSIMEDPKKEPSIKKVF